MLSHGEPARIRGPCLPETLHSSWRGHPLSRGAVSTRCLHARKAVSGQVGGRKERRPCVWVCTSGAHVCACPRVESEDVLQGGKLANASVRTSGMDVRAHVRIHCVETGVRVRMREQGKRGHQRPQAAASLSCVTMKGLDVAPGFYV